MKKKTAKSILKAALLVIAIALPLLVSFLLCRYTYNRHYSTYITPYLVKNLYDDATAASVRVQYGGSVKPTNIKEYMAMEDIDGIMRHGVLYVETEEDFQALKEWVKTMRFERMGAFAYSDEEGTYANLHYQDDIPEEEKQRRVDELMAIQQEISGTLLAQKTGTIQRVIIDAEEGDYYVGRTEYDSPEVDCNVLIDKHATDAACTIGAFYDVKITKAEEFDLFGELWNKN